MAAGSLRILAMRPEITPGDLLGRLAADVGVDLAVIPLESGDDPRELNPHAILLGGLTAPEQVASLRTIAPVFVVADCSAEEEHLLVRAGAAAVIPMDRYPRLPTAIAREVASAEECRAREAAEGTLRTGIDQLGTLLSRVDGIVYGYDVEAGRFTYVSPNAAGWLGSPLEDWFEPEFWGRRVHPDDGNRVQAEWRQVVQDRSGGTLEYRLIGTDGRERWCQDRIAFYQQDGDRLVVAGILVDVSRAREIDAAERMVLQLTAHRVGGDFLDSLAAALTRTLGVRWAVIGAIAGDRLETVALAVDGNLVEATAYPLATTPCGVVARGEPYFVGDGVAALYPDCPLIQQVGARSYRGVPLIGSGSEPIGVLAVLDDKPRGPSPAIDAVLALCSHRAAAELDRIRGEAERATLQSQLIQAQKMEAIGTLAGGLAHDLNNVLMGILGNAEMAKDDLPAAHPASGNIIEVIRAAHRARDVVQRVLTFSRKREPQRELLSLTPLVDEAVALLRATIPATIGIVVDHGPEVPPASIDPHLVRQAVMNLGANATQAIGPRNGVISFRTEVVDVGHDLARTHVPLAERRYVRLAVRDDGPGIDQAVLGRIFDPFFTTKDPGQGTGLGLSVVHGIMEEHGGAVIVDSAVGRGTTVHLYFPTTEPAPQAAPSPVAGSMPPGRGEHVLLVDDETLIVRVGKRMLERLGYRVTAAETATEALRVFTARPDDFQAVISDLTMPGYTGRELASRFRALRPSIKFILTTGHLGAERISNPDVDAMLAKPFGADRLAQVLHELLHHNGAP